MNCSVPVRRMKRSTRMLSIVHQTVSWSPTIQLETKGLTLMLFSRQRLSGTQNSLLGSCDCWVSSCELVEARMHVIAANDQIAISKTIRWKFRAAWVTLQPGHLRGMTSR